MSNFTRVEGHQDLVRDLVRSSIVIVVHMRLKRRLAEYKGQRDEIRSATREINTEM